MKEDVLQRVKQLVTTKSKSVNEFASKIGMYQNTVNNQLNGVRSISLDLILAVLATFPDISAEWLLRGTGSMLVAEKTANTYNIKGTDNSVELHGGSQIKGNVTTNSNNDKEIIAQLLQQNQQLIMMLAQKK